MRHCSTGLRLRQPGEDLGMEEEDRKTGAKSRHVLLNGRAIATESADAKIRTLSQRWQRMRDHLCDSDEQATKDE